MATQENNQIKNQQLMQAVISYLSQFRADQPAAKLTPMTNIESSSQINVDPRIQNLLYLSSLYPQIQLLYAQLTGYSNNSMMPNQRLAQLVAMQSIFQNAQPTVNNMYFHNTFNQLNNINLNLSNCAHSGTQFQELRTSNEPSSNSQGNLKMEKKVISNEPKNDLNVDSSLFSNLSESEENQKYSKKENIIKGILKFYIFKFFQFFEQ
jgi:hypothetical protein